MSMSTNNHRSPLSRRLTTPGIDSASEEASTPPGVTQAEVRAVSVKAAAALLSLSEDELWEMLRAGELLVLRRGRRVLVPVAEIDAYVERHKAPWTAAAAKGAA